MKFSFEKIQKKTPENATEALEVQEELTELEKQEQFDAECVEEAEKLGKGIEELKAELDSFGGPGKFKERFELRSDRGDQNIAGSTVNKLDYESWSANSEAKNLSKAAAVMFALTTALEAVNYYEHGGDNPVAHGVAGFTALLGLIPTIEAIKQKWKSLRLEKQKKIEALKFKMTGTEVK